MPTRTRPYVLLFRVLLVAIPAATIALLTFSDRVDGLMPRPSFFTVPVCAIAVISGCIEVATLSGVFEGASYTRSVRPLAVLVRRVLRRSG